MEKLSEQEIEKDYQKIKSKFQTENSLGVAEDVAEQIPEHEENLRKVFSFLISAFKGKLRNDKKTPLVFHSIYLTKLMYMCGENELDSLLVPALHDVLEDTEVSEKELVEEDFMKGREQIISYLKILKEDVSLSREPDGIHLPPRYIEHINRIIGAPREVINTEIIDRFSDLMDLEYILRLPEEERELRLRSKIIKVKSFVYNIIDDRDDFNKNCLKLFEEKVKKIEETYNLKARAEKVKSIFEKRF